jgi:hypothetical protein
MLHAAITAIKQVQNGPLGRRPDARRKRAINCADADGDCYVRIHDLSLRELGLGLAFLMDFKECLRILSVTRSQLLVRLHKCWDCCICPVRGQKGGIAPVKARRERTILARHHSLRETQRCGKVLWSPIIIRTPERDLRLPVMSRIHKLELGSLPVEVSSTNLISTLVLT